jgi:hypothetical protein
MIEKPKVPKSLAENIGTTSIDLKFREKVAEKHLHENSPLNPQEFLWNSNCESVKQGSSRTAEKITLGISPQVSFLLEL